MRAKGCFAERLTVCVNRAKHSAKLEPSIKGRSTRGIINNGLRRP